MLSLADVERLYRKATLVPQVTRGVFSSEDSVTLTLSQLDAISSRRTPSQLTLVLSPATQTAVMATPPAPIDPKYKSSRQSRFTPLLSVRARSGEKDAEKTLIEIWSEKGLVDSVEVPHTLTAEAEFATLDLSPCGKRVLFSADTPKPKATGGVFKDSTVNAGEEETSSAPLSSSSAPLSTSAYEFKETWGEQLQTLSDPRLYILSFETRTVSRVATSVENDPHLASVAGVGQGLFLADGERIVFTRYLMPGGVRRNGLRFCSNRPSELVLSTGPSGPRVRLTRVEDGRFARCPALAQDGTLFFFDVDAASPTHQTPVRLMALQPAGAPGAATVVVDVVSSLAGADAFPGIFPVAGLSSRFITPEEVLLESQWRTGVRVLRVDRRTGAVTALPTTTLGRCTRLLDVDQGPSRKRALFTVSSPTAPERVFVMGLEALAPGDPLYSVAEPLAGCSSTILPCGEAGLGAEAMLVLPEKPSSKLILFPHGGPHSAFGGEWGPATATFLACGFAVLQVNYRGSTGFGLDSIRALQGRYGTIDVEDCLSALATARASHQGFSDVYIYGGSHGGFLAAHLVARAPTLFRATAMRNPVINMASMSAATDIPDWTACAIGADPLAQPDDKDLVAMYKASPIAHVASTTAAVLLLVGAKDLRVPPQQSVEYYYALKRTAKCPVKMLVFPEDNHPIASPAAEPDATINSILWFLNN